ncbi:Methyltransferase small domain-containing protein [Kytococcus aerolatus]|uniref:Methyltransferase small domain-containing protein n=1 Tax=Kytococcus aerolatus TaxID=592308 RepID=A0A212U695_9MICO|nr:class I SAM-dependent methyltransferase [Kytococcus aerolatus]SNC73785.1 Methyltransferase small domain-containing protein [Kytococcus aerolatus]
MSSSTQPGQPAPSTTSVPPPRLVAADGTDLAPQVAALRADLTAAGYTIDGIRACLGEVASDALEREQSLPADLATRGRREPVALLTRLLGLGLPLTVEELATALPTLGAEGALALGIVRVEGDTYRAAVDLRPHATEHDSWWVVSDLPELQAGGGPLPEDHVLGIGGASVTLAAWTPRPEVARALDIGTGCGVQALHLTHHAQRVVATDISERALEFARFTCALNGVELDLRHGSLTEPVAGEEFDLIVSNPPFVITPRTKGVPVYEYRDGGVEADGITSGLIGQVAALLAPGGMAQMLGNWEIGPDEDWRDRVRPWLAGLGVDAWVVLREVQDPAEYAETWARDGGHTPGDGQYEAMYGAWLDDFAARGTASIGFGVITLHRPEVEREPWIALDEARGQVDAAMGPHVLAGVRARTWLAEHSDDELLDIAWQYADDVTQERYYAHPGDPDPQVVLIRQGGGLRRAFQVDTVTAGLVGVCDGDLTARQGLAGIAVLTEADQSDLARQVLPVLRDLVADGLLVR